MSDVSIDVSMTIDGRSPGDYARGLKRYPAEAARALRTTIEYILTDVQGRAIRAAPRLTGDLARNIGNRGSKGIFRIRVSQSANVVSVTGVVGSSLPHAGIQDTGGRVKPKRAQWLTIPLDAAKTAAGVPRGRARDFEDTFFLNSKRGNLLLVQRKADGIVPLFVLKKQVDIEGTEYLTGAAEQALQRSAQQVAKGIESALKRSTS